jgi:hypothetical protein
MRDPDFFLRRYAPVTTTIAFFEMSPRPLAEAVFARSEEINRMWQLPWKAKMERADGDLTKKLDALLPLTSAQSSKVLLSGTKSGWSTYIPNGYPTNDVHTEPRFLGQQLGVRTLSIVMVNDEPKGQPGSLQFVLRDIRDGAVKTRSIVVHKESRWEFREDGDPLPFEELEKCRAKKITDRLTVDMIERYAAHLGIHLFDPYFYAGEAHVVHTCPAPNAVFYPEYPHQKDARGVLAS